MLADPRVPREPFDWLKYVPLSPYNSKTYLSFGGDIRERFEANNAVNFGVPKQPGLFALPLRRVRRSSYR